MAAQVDVVGGDLDDVVEAEAGGGQAVAQEAKGIAELGFRVFGDREVRMGPGDAGEKDEVAGVERGRQVPVVDPVGDFVRCQDLLSWRTLPFSGGVEVGFRAPCGHPFLAAACNRPP